MSERPHDIEWPTLGLIAACYVAWVLATTAVAGLSLPLAIALAALSITLHSSLQHEVLHGHPFRSRFWNEMLVFLPVGLFFPYGRFRDLHLAHHRDERLTDPYDDPESNYLEPAVWARMPRWAKAVLRVNNTLAGRMLFGPVISIYATVKKDAQAILAGNRAVARDWALHGLGLVLVALWLSYATMPVWAYLVAAYLGMSILKIRTFLEHRACERARGRTVIIEGGRVLPFLFLNNNLHAVHHCKPGVAWYRLPQLYAESRDAYLRRNEGYYFTSYAEIFRRYFLRAKDPVPHPLRPQD